MVIYSLQWLPWLFIHSGGYRGDLLALVLRLQGEQVVVEYEFVAAFVTADVVVLALGQTVARAEGESHGHVSVGEGLTEGDASLLGVGPCAVIFAAKLEEKKIISC